MDDLLAQHVAHLFIRDPISLFKEKLHQSTEDEVDHFEVCACVCASVYVCVCVCVVCMYVFLCV